LLVDVASGLLLLLLIYAACQTSCCGLFDACMEAVIVAGS